MTYKELLKKLNPNADEEQLEDMMIQRCPSAYAPFADFECMDTDITCEQCWDLEWKR